MFTLGSAGFFGSMGGRPLNAPAALLVGVWLLGADGGTCSREQHSAAAGWGNAVLTRTGQGCLPERRLRSPWWGAYWPSAHPVDRRRSRRRPCPVRLGYRDVSAG